MYQTMGIMLRCKENSGGVMAPYTLWMQWLCKLGGGDGSVGRFGGNCRGHIKISLRNPSSRINKEKNQINSMAPNLSKPHRIEQGHSEQKATAHSYRPIP